MLFGVDLIDNDGDGALYEGPDPLNLGGGSSNEDQELDTIASEDELSAANDLYDAVGEKRAKELIKESGSAQAALDDSTQSDAGLSQSTVLLGLGVLLTLALLARGGL